MAIQSNKIEKLLHDIFLEKLDENLLPFQSIILYSQQYYKDNSKKFSSFMSEGNLSEVLIFYVKNLIEKKVVVIQPQKITVLTELFSEKEINDIKNDINSYMNSFPKSYFIDYSLDNVVLNTAYEREITSNITFSFKRKQRSGLLTVLNEEYSLHIIINYQGYINNFTYEEPRSILKQIIYSAISLGIFKSKKISLEGIHIWRVREFTGVMILLNKDMKRAFL